MPASVMDPQFWVGLGQIIVVNIILSGDNAVVIALAARSLPEAQRKLAVLWGSIAAIVMRVILTIVAVEMLRLPYLKLVGSVLLFWIALQLLLPENEDGHGLESHDNLMAAIRTILLADLVMSLDNVIAVAAAADGDNLLLILGLGISIPLVIFGSTLILKLMDRYPIIITLGAALLGYVSGEMLVTDPALNLPESGWQHQLIPLGGAALVVIAGKWLAQRKLALAPQGLVDLADEEDQPKSNKPH
ncbi:TerC family protein [Methylomagnum sp.]